jgi:hypothetical protein
MGPPAADLRHSLRFDAGGEIGFVLHFFVLRIAYCVLGSAFGRG